MVEKLRYSHEMTHGSQDRFMLLFIHSNMSCLTYCILYLTNCIFDCLLPKYKQRDFSITILSSLLLLYTLNWNNRIIIRVRVTATPLYNTTRWIRQDYDYFRNYSFNIRLTISGLYRWLYILYLKIYFITESCNIFN